MVVPLVSIPTQIFTPFFPVTTVYSMQLNMYVITFASGLRHVNRFSSVSCTSKTFCHDMPEIVLKSA